MPETLPIMPALCSMLFDAHYAPNYAGVISSIANLAVYSFKNFKTLIKTIIII